MASLENVSDENATQPKEVAAEEHGNQETLPDLSLQGASAEPTSMLTNVAESEGQAGVPGLQNPPVNVLNDLTREQLERPSEATGSSSPVDILRIEGSFGPTPAVAQASRATAKVNSSGGQAGLWQWGQDSANVSGRPPAMMTGGTNASMGGSEMGGSSADEFIPFTPRQMPLPPRGPPVRAPSNITYHTSGVMLELPPIRSNMQYRDRLAQDSVPAGVPQAPAPSTSSTRRGSICFTRTGILNPQHPLYNPLFPLHFTSDPQYYTPSTTPPARPKKSKKKEKK
ncbi:proline-rich protein 32 [Suncus etruscus]|uniref:proline-rich protein 32 n=1 Tax=Suncus etruscus TaxID=109475 RepID=UPI00210FBDE5|nr:proline-rich protein 32 [Suncus etruscus]